MPRTPARHAIGGVTRGGGTTMHYENTFAIHTHPSKAYKIVSDPTNIPKYNPDIENVAITKITPGLVGTQMRIRTKENKELFAEVIEAASGRSCAFQTDSGRIIRWDIKAENGLTSLTSTIDTEAEIDEASYRPKMERAFRLLRSDLKRQSN